MKRKMIVMIASMLLLICGAQSEAASTQMPHESAGNSVMNQRENDPSESSKSAEDTAIPGSYTIPDGWVKAEKYSTGRQIFYIEEGHENDERPDNIAIHVGKNKYSLNEHGQFRDAIVKQLLMQLKGIEADLHGDGTYTAQGDLLYIFTIDEGNVVTTQYYILKDYGFCLVQLTNFSGSETSEEAARTMADSFVWNIEAE